MLLTASFLCFLSFACLDSMVGLFSSSLMFLPSHLFPLFPVKYFAFSSWCLFIYLFIFTSVLFSLTHHFYLCFYFEEIPRQTRASNSAVTSMLIFQLSVTLWRAHTPFELTVSGVELIILHPTPKKPSSNVQRHSHQQGTRDPLLYSLSSFSSILQPVSLSGSGSCLLSAFLDVLSLDFGFWIQ